METLAGRRGRRGDPVTHMTGRRRPSAKVHLDQIHSSPEVLVLLVLRVLLLLWV